MNLFFRLSKRGCCFILILITVFHRVGAQQWVQYEISRENDGDSSGPFGGILGTMIFFGFMWLLVNILEDKKKTDSNPPKNKCESEYEKFQRECIAIYGEYAELGYALVFIKEDGEYRQITHQDKRYEVLSAYILRNHKERNNTVGIIGNKELLIDYIVHYKDYNVFPAAKPMDMHGKLEKEFYGGRIAMMKAYFWQKKYPCLFKGPRLGDYCLSLGWDLCIYIHKYIGQSMDKWNYRDLKDMTLRNMTKEEYQDYRSKADIISNRSEGCFDGWGNYIGKDYGEASAELDKRRGVSYEQAIAEVRQIEWHLEPGETIHKMKLVTDKLLEQ